MIDLDVVNPDGAVAGFSDPVLVIIGTPEETILFSKHFAKIAQLLEDGYPLWWAIQEANECQESIVKDTEGVEHSLKYSMGFQGDYLTTTCTVYLSAAERAAMNPPIPVRGQFKKWWLAWLPAGVVSGND